MASSGVAFENKSASPTAVINSRSNLVFKDKTKTMQTRVLYGALIVLVITVLALLIALIVVATNDDDKDSSVGGGQSSAGQSGAIVNDLPQVDCSWASSNLEKAKCVLDSYPLVDGHNDLSYRYRMFADNKVYEVDLTADLRVVWNTSLSQTDIPRLRTGKLGAQFWANYVPCDSQYKDAVRLSLEQHDVIKKFVARYPDTFQWVTTAQGIIDAFRAGKIGSLVGLEGGHSIDSSLGNLRMFYDLGVRYMTVTHSCNTPWADNWMMDNPENINEAKLGGLTAFGEIIIKEMNRLGMLIDLSHVAKATMVDALRVTKAPVIYSHSSAFAICNHYRNVQDDVLQLTKANGGLVMVNFYDLYINCPPDNTTTTSIGQVADHIDYIKNLIGVDFVGIGADYDGVPTLPQGLEDVSTYPALYAELIARGWKEGDLQKISGRNLIRVLKQTEKVRDEMSYMAPYEDFMADDHPNTNNTCKTPYGTQA